METFLNVVNVFFFGKIFLNLKILWGIKRERKNR